MAAVDIFQASRMQQIEDTTVVGGLVDVDGNLLLTTREGTEINAGYVKGPEGDKGDKGDDGIQGSVAIPAGTISLWGSDVAPTNWMICDGAAISRTEYPTLFAAIGTQYGAGDGVTTFNLPNLSGQVPVGKDAAQTEFDTLGEAGGAKTASQTQSHSHALSASGWAHIAMVARASHQLIMRRIGTNSVAMTHSLNRTELGGGAGSYSTAEAAGAELGGATDSSSITTTVSTLQPYRVVNFIIKYTAGETPGDSELTQRISELEASYGTTPAGTISAWGGDTAPPNWLFCDGAAVSRTTYATLFSAIGTRFGAGDGINTFNLPNLKGRMAVGLDPTQTEFDVLGETGGTKTHTHQHVSPIGSASGNSYVLNVTNAIMDSPGSYDLNRIANPAAFSGGALTPNSGAMEIYNVTSSASGTLSPYLVVNYIIKTTQGITPGDSQLSVRVAQLESQIGASALLVRDRMDRAQRVFNGGGIRKVTANGISWNQRFIVLGQGWEDPALNGYWNIDMPPNGTVIEKHGFTGSTVYTVAAGEIPMSGFSALYYDLPLSGNEQSDPSRFKFVSYLAKLAAPIPPNWVLIATRNTDGWTAPVKWGDGRYQDYWKTLTLAGAWVHYLNAWAPGAWRFMGDGSIKTRGLISTGALGLAAGFSNELMPATGEGELFQLPSNTGQARIDLRREVGGIYVQSYVGGGSNAWVSLSGLQWMPAG